MQLNEAYTPRHRIQVYRGKRQETFIERHTGSILVALLLLTALLGGVIGG